MRCAGSCCPIRRPSATSNGRSAGSRARRASSSACGGWRWRRRAARARTCALDKKVARATAAVGEAIEGLQFNKAVAALYELTNAIEKAAPSASRDAAIRTLLLLAAPAAPHLAEQAWSARGEAGMIADAAWPSHDPALLVDDEVTIAVQVNGKLRDTLTAARGLAKDDAEALALASPKVQAQLGGSAAAQGDCGSRPAGQYRRMIRARRPRPDARCRCLAGCGLRPVYAGGASGPVATLAVGDQRRADPRPRRLADAQRAGRPARRRE